MLTSNTNPKFRGSRDTCGQMVRALDNGSWDRGSSPGKDIISMGKETFSDEIHQRTDQNVRRYFKVMCRPTINKA